MAGVMERVMIQITVISAVSVNPFFRRKMWGWRERDEYGSIDHDMLTKSVPTYNIGDFRYVPSFQLADLGGRPCSERWAAAGCRCQLCIVGDLSAK